MVGIVPILGQKPADVVSLVPLNWAHCSIPAIFHNLPDEYSKMWYALILGELKAAFGPSGKGRLQNLTACMLSLNIVFHLARKARSADRDSFRHPNATVRKVYGVQSGFGDAKFEIIVMKAQTEAQAREIADKHEAPRLSLSEDQQQPEAVDSEHTNTPDKLVIVGYVSAIPCKHANLASLISTCLPFDLESYPHFRLR